MNIACSLKSASATVPRRRDVGLGARAVASWALLASMAILGGCGADDKAEPKVKDTTVLPIFDGSGGFVDAVVDTGVDEAGVDAKSGCPGAAGCACSDNSECDDALCIAWPDGKRCAALCDGTGCVDGGACAQVPTSGGDSISACVPPHATLCDPCKLDKDCIGPGSGDARCIDWGDDGAFCGAGCGDGIACPDGYTCSNGVTVKGTAVKQCRPVDNALCVCSPLAIQNELSTLCRVKGTGKASCPGQRACVGDGKSGAPAGGGLTPCQGKAPGPEVCDGVDNDCDGGTDNDLSDCDDKDQCTIDTCDASLGCVYLPSTKLCDDGDACTGGDICATTAGVLACAGKAFTCDDGDPCTIDACNPAIGCTQTATGAECDDDDPCTTKDNCANVDGKIKCAGDATLCDDGDPCTADNCDPSSGDCSAVQLSGASCDDGDACSAGDACGEQAGGGFGCVAGKAQNCDDANLCTLDSCDPAKGCVNSADVGKAESCYSGAAGSAGKGICKAGSATCGGDGALGSCLGEVVPAAKDGCDELDDDCDGDTDEDCVVDTGPIQVAWRMGGTTIDGASAGGQSVRAFVGGSVHAGKLANATGTSIGLGFYEALLTWWK